MTLDVFTILDVLGTLAFAISGASLAIKKGFDIFGVFVLAFVTAVGGGTMRDLLIGNTPVEWMNDNIIIITVVVGAGITLLFNPIVDKINYFVYLFDAIGLGFFTMAGIQKALEFEFSIFICIAMGTMSATFGGLIRDIITGEKPMLLTRKEIYALAGASGGVLYFVLRWLDVPEEVNVPLTIVFIFSVRHLTKRFNISLPSVDQNGKWFFHKND